MTNRRQSLPEQEQLRRLVDGSWHTHVRAAFPDVVDHRNLVSVTKADIEKYLKENPVLADKTYKECAKPADKLPYHDVPALWQDASGYHTAMMDHGKPEWLSTFQTREGALADFLCLSYGLSD